MILYLVQWCSALRVFKVFSLAVFLGSGVVWGQVGLGQQAIVPDGTLGVESSQNIPIGAIDFILGGARRGNNLFHSFEEFGIAAGRSGYFIVNDLAIQNILARVTGTRRSEILGTMGTRSLINNQPLSSLSDALSSPANLFLINPNGIIFGPSALLDVGASFMATTAKSVGFGDQGFFDVDSPDTPALLTINPSAFFFNQTPGPIINNSGPFLQINLPVEDILQSVALRQSIDPLVNAIQIQNTLLKGLRVPEGKSLVLLGREIISQNSSLSASGGRIEVGSVAGSGAVGLTINDNDFQLSFPEILPRSDILLINSSITTLAGGRGNISLTGRDIKVTKESVVVTGIIGELGTPTSKSGDININATRNIEISDTSRILSATALASGDSGNINLKGQNITISNGSNIASASVGGNDAGTVFLKAEDLISISGRNSNGLTSNIVAATAGFSPITQQGNGGNVKFEARDISLSDDASVFTNTLASRGNSGNINLQSKNSFVLKDGSLFSTTSNGQGNAGNIDIHSGNIVQFNGVNSITGKSGGLQSTIESLGILPSDRTRQAGKLKIETRSLEVIGGAGINSSTSGEGNASDVEIVAHGNILFQGASADDKASSFAASEVKKGAKGNGGDVKIEAENLVVRNGARLSAQTGGKGDAGNVTVVARDSILIDGSAPVNGVSSAILTRNIQILSDGSVSRGTGVGGNINLNTPNLQVSNGAVIDSRTVNNQSGGDITLTLGQLNLLSGGQLLSTSDGSGPAGTVRINANDGIRVAGNDPTYADRLARFTTAVAPITANSGIYVRSTATGAAGNVIIGDQGSTPRLNLDGGEIVADSNAVTGGNITINASQSLIMRNSSLISATAGRAQGAGDGGNITIASPVVLSIPGENNDIIANAFSGTGGNVTINAEAILNFTLNDKGKPFEQLRAQPTNDISASSQFGSNGTLNLIGFNVNPAQGATQLPTTTTIPQPSQGCETNSAQQKTEFFVSGRGGQQQTPEDPLSSSEILDDLRPPSWISVQPPPLAKPLSMRIAQATPSIPWSINLDDRLRLLVTASHCMLHETPKTQQP